MPDGGTVIAHRIPPYSPGEVFMPTCPVQRCAASCDPDALYCVECGARLYPLSSGKYGGPHATAESGA
jgi:hypothetical protein